MEKRILGQLKKGAIPVLAKVINSWDASQLDSAYEQRYNSGGNIVTSLATPAEWLAAGATAWPCFQTSEPNNTQVWGKNKPTKDDITAKVAEYQKVLANVPEGKIYLDRAIAAIATGNLTSAADLFFQTVSAAGIKSRLRCIGTS